MTIERNDNVKEADANERTKKVSKSADILFYNSSGSGFENSLKHGPKPIVVNAIPTTSSSIDKINRNEKLDHENCVASGQINYLSERIQEIMLRLSSLELRLSNIENGNGLMKQNQILEIKSAVQQLRHVSTQVEIISDGLRSTLGYNIGKTYNCDSCNSIGTAAIKLKCTACGTETWWGWWPKKK